MVAAGTTHALGLESLVTVDMTDAAANERRVAEHAAAIERLAALLAQDAIARDQAGGHAAAARRHIRDSGLLASTAPVVLGGWGLCWRYFHRGLRRLAMVDSALAHVYAFHHLQLATLQLYGTQAQHQDLIVPTLRERLFWGNALNPSDRRALAFEDGEGFRFDGPKGYASGAVGADWLTVSAWHSASASFVVAVDRKSVV